VLVAGIEPIAARLQQIVSLSASPEDQAPERSPDEIVVAAAARFAGARRRAIGRIAKGPKNLALRHAFGISLVMRPTSEEEVRRACLALLSGRADHPNTPAARLINPADVKKAKALVAQLDEIKGRAGARKSSDAETARTRDVLHAALELFYDRFGAAVDLAFEEDDALRVSLLGLIPRRRERRAGVVVAPAVPQPARAMGA
jgi:hypothetical protein